MDNTCLNHPSRRAMHWPERLCCECYVASGGAPSDWHPGCLEAGERSELARLQARVEELEAEAANTEKYLAEIVSERIEEIGAEADAFDKDATNTLKALLEQSEGFDWRDYPDGWSSQDAYDFLTTDRQEAWNSYERERKRAEAAEARNAALVKALEPFARVTYAANTFNRAALSDEDFRLARAALAGDT